MTLQLPAPRPDHPVRAAQRRIAEAFAERGGAVLAPNQTGVVAVLVPLLDRLGWRGTPRQIAEAMPHEVEVSDVASLRAVLWRLSVETPLLEVRSTRLRPDHCPCLVSRGPEQVTLVASVEPDGRYTVFDVATNQWTTVRRKSVRGEVRLARKADAALRSESLQREGFIGPALRSFAPALYGVFWQSFFISLIGLAVSLYVMFVYDKAIGTKSFDTLIMLALAALVGLGVEIRLRHRRARAIARIAARFDALVVTGALGSVLHLPLSMSESAPLGAQLARFRQFEVGREIFGGSLATALVELPFTLFFFALIFALAGSIGFVPVALAAVLAIIGIATDPVSSKQNRDMGEWKTKSDSLLVEITTRMRAIKDDHCERIWLDRASESYRRYLEARFRGQHFSSTLQTLAQSLVTIAAAGVLGIGAVEVMGGSLSTGALIAVMAVVWRVLGPIQTVFLSLHRLKSTVQTLRQIEQLMKMRPEWAGHLGAGPGRAIRGAIAVNNACLRHGTRTDLTLKGVSLDIAPGEFVVVTGSSGSGKSSLLKSILGLYPLQAGSVRLDDIDLRQLDPSEARRSVLFLGQDPTLFFGTIAQNLRLVAPDATTEELAAAMRMVGIPHDHAALREGLDTRLTAVNRQAMSPAFIQRLALARMFVRHAPILLFDDPSTHLDRDGDEALIRAISGARGKSTIVMVTARPSHMRLADRVVVMADGQVVAQGKPDVIVPALLAQADKSAA